MVIYGEKHHLQSTSVRFFVHRRHRHHMFPSAVAWDKWKFKFKSSFILLRIASASFLHPLSYLITAACVRITQIRNEKKKMSFRKIYISTLGFIPFQSDGDERQCRLMLLILYNNWSIYVAERLHYSNRKNEHTEKNKAKKNYISISETKKTVLF